MIIDIHEHYSYEKDYLGRLLDSMDKAGIDRTCLSPYPPCFEYPGNRKVMEAAEKYPDRIIPFGFVRLGEDGPDFVRELRDEGFRGLKMHTPPLNYDDTSFFPVYAKAAELELPILFHAGMVGVQPAKGKEKYNVSGARMRPAFIDTIAKAFPGLNIIIAHLGMPWHEEAVITLRYNRNVYSDLALGNHYGFDNYSPSFFRSLFLRDKDFMQIVFGGSHYGHSGWILERRYMDIFRALGIDQSIQNKILGETLASILKI